MAGSRYGRAEDGGTMAICVITPDDVAPFLRATGRPSSEICAPASGPAGDRLRFSSQHGTNGSGNGLTHEAAGPFPQRPLAVRRRTRRICGETGPGHIFPPQRAKYSLRWRSQGDTISYLR